MYSLIISVQVAVGHQFVASFLHIGADAIHHRLNQIREKLLSFKHLLPYGNTINAKNVFSHARAIARMSNVLEQQQTAAAGTTMSGQGTLNSAELGPASRALTESQKPALEAAKLEAKIPKDYSKRRKRVRFEEETAEGREKGEEEKPANKEPEISGAAAGDEDDDDDKLGSDSDDLDASEIDMYLRSAEEVEAFREAYEALEGAATASRRDG